jgi:soluble lytic murein transglycosylase
VRFGEQLWKSFPQDYVLELAPQDLVDLLYPVPYRESLRKHASARAVDPRFVISIARQESRFQQDAKSVAAARGLMQFIPDTSNQIAAQLGIKDFSQDRLYNPDMAILFGSEYLANLFKQFPVQPQAVAAAYNSGPENVTRWIARSRSSEPDRYVPELGFSQTKDYVYKVMTNFWIYQKLYDEKLNRN